MTENQVEFVSTDVEDFAVELYDYIWTQHRFRSKLLQKVLAEKRSLMIKEPKKKVSKFDNNIGNAVLCSQYLLRGYCEFAFKCYEKDLIDDKNIFYVCIFDAINKWINKRTCVFFKVFDSAAIIAEVVLFCDAELNTVIDLSRASVTFKNYFLTFLQTEFFENGGWDGLKSIALEDYRNLYLNLKPYICSLQHPYAKLQHCCSLIRKLRESPVPFPVEVSMTCGDCKSMLDLTYRRYKDDTNFKHLMKDLIDESIEEEDLFQKISDLIKGFTASESRSKTKNEILNDEDYILYGVYFGNKEPGLLLAEEIGKRSKSSMKRTNSIETSP